MSFNERIRLIRKNAHKTQSEFGQTLGINSSASWEKAANPQIPTESMKLLICRTYHVNKHWLDTGEGEMYTDEARIAAIAQNDVVRSILEIYARLSPDGQDAFDTIVAEVAAAFKESKPCTDEEVNALIDAALRAATVKFAAED